MKLLQKWLNNWILVDTRTLALFRIFFGFVGFFDVLRRFHVIDVFYSNEGMNFRQQVASQYSIKYFTLLHYFHSSLAVHLFFLITLICFFFFIIGYRTRLFQIFSVIGLLSIHNAAIILESGADMAINSYLVWALFLPLGISWSIDSLRKSLKDRKEDGPGNLNIPIQFQPKNIFHIAYIACLVQLSMIYFYNFINKTGDMWSDGTAIFYMYQLETYLTPLGAWLKIVLGLGIIKFFTTMTVYMEMLAPILILSPIFQPWLRRITVLLFIPFHFIIAISVNIGMFSWVMIAVLLLLLSSQDMDILRKISSRFYTRKYMVFYDRDCGFCHLTARILRRMDIFSSLTWSDRLEEKEKPEKLNLLLETTIVVWDKQKNRTWTRHKAFGRILFSLPMGFILGWIFYIPGVEKIFGYMYDWVSGNRTLISKKMGLSACGIPSSEIPIEDSVKTENIFVLKSRKLIWVLSNFMAFSLLLGVVDYSTQINDGLKTRFPKEEKKITKKRGSYKSRSPRWRMKRVLMYPRMYQEWNMFSPKVMMYEKWLIADLTFSNGEKLTLFQASNDIQNQFDHRYFVPYNNQFWRKFFTRLSKSNYKKNIPKFKSWLKKTDYFSQIKGRNVESVQLFSLSERSPDPYKKKQYSVTKRELKEKDFNSKKRKKDRVKQSTKGRMPRSKKRIK